MRLSKRLAILLIAGAFCACSATLIASVLIVLLWAAPAHAFAHWYQVPQGIVMMCLYTFIPAGGFGFLCGVLGSIYLGLRVRRITSRGRLLAESAVIGALLSALFPLFYLAMGWGRPDWQEGRAILFCMAVGCPTSILYAGIFGESLLNEGADHSRIMNEPDRVNPS
jgi:hypothetical protein